MKPIRLSDQTIVSLKCPLNISVYDFLLAFHQNNNNCYSTAPPPFACAILTWIVEYCWANAECMQKKNVAKLPNQNNERLRFNTDSITMHHKPSSLTLPIILEKTNCGRNSFFLMRNKRHIHKSNRRQNRQRKYIYDANKIHWIQALNLTFIDWIIFSFFCLSNSCLISNKSKTLSIEQMQNGEIVVKILNFCCCCFIVWMCFFPLYTEWNTARKLYYQPPHKQKYIPQQPRKKMRTCCGWARKMLNWYWMLWKCTIISRIKCSAKIKMISL